MPFPDHYYSTDSTRMRLANGARLSAGPQWILAGVFMCLSFLGSIAIAAEMRIPPALPENMEVLAPFRAKSVCFVPEPQIHGLASGDVNSDGRPEILVGTSPSSGLFLVSSDNDLAELTLSRIGWDLGLPKGEKSTVSNIAVADFDADGDLEIATVTDHLEELERIRLCLFVRQGGSWNRRCFTIPTDSHWTHGLVSFDSDGDGRPELYSTHCGGGEIYRHRFDQGMTRMETHLLKQMWAPGESLEIADPMGDGHQRLIVVQGDDEKHTAVKIYRIGAGGLSKWPEAFIDFDCRHCYADAATCIGDVDNDGTPELVVAWVTARYGTTVTLMAYRIARNGDVRARLPFAELATEYTASYGRSINAFERALVIGRLGRASRNSLYVCRPGIGITEYTVCDGKVLEALVLRLPRVWAGRLLLTDLDGDDMDELVVGTLDTTGESRRAPLLVITRGNKDAEL